MCNLCDNWDSGLITIDSILKKIAKKIKNTKNQAEKQHLWELSDRILEDDLSTEPRNEDLDAEWWAATHKKPY